MFEKISRCRICKKEFKQVINNDIINVGINLEKEKNNNEIHFCDNGDIGIIELIGYRNKK
ncbi:hypothetical protein LXJ15735_04440 [Lacrimispora xylanolytica]